MICTDKYYLRVSGLSSKIDISFSEYDVIHLSGPDHIPSFMVNLWSPGLTKELTARVVIITFLYSIISYFYIETRVATPDQLAGHISLLFVTFGVVMLINILFCLRKYHVWDAKR
jgi:hypothetical protein